MRRGFLPEPSCRARVYNPGCGRTALHNTERAFWQSRMTVNGVVAPLPDLVDLEKLARQIHNQRNAR